MTRMRVLIVTDDANMGGTYRVAEQLVFGLREYFDVQFACSCNAKNAASRSAMAEAGAAVLDYGASERNLQRSAFAFRDAARLVETVEPAVLLLVESAEIWSLLALKKVAELRGIPYVTAINLLSADCLSRFGELRERSIDALRAAQAIIFVSNASRRRFEALLPEVGRPLHVVSNSCPDKFFAPVDRDARMAARQRLGLCDDDLVFFTAARIEPRKGQPLCLEALARLRDREGLNGIRFVFAGGGAQGDIDEFRRAIEAKGLSGNVSYLGPRNDVPSLLEASDVFVLASYAEGMPLSIIEAMAKGRPVIATEVDGIPEQLDRLSGILVPSPSKGETACIEAIADAMAFLRREARARLDMGRCAKLRALQLFSENRMIFEYARILSEVVASATPRENASSFRRSKRRPFALVDLLRGLDDARDVARRRDIARDWRRGLAPGSAIEFSDPLQCWLHAGDGWSQAESDGVWSDGATSTLELGLRRPVGRLRIVFDLRPFVPPGHRQETDVLVNGVKVDAWVFDAYLREERVVDLRTSDIGRGETLEIRFVHKSAASPHAFGLSADSRELAIFLYEIKIERIPFMESARANLELRLR